MEEITANYTIPDNEPISANYSVEPETVFDVSFRISMTPTKYSELDDDIGLSARIDSLEQSENNEMIDIVSLLERRTENMVDFNDDEE